MKEYYPWDESWQNDIVYIMVPQNVDVPVEVPLDFSYPVFVAAINKKLEGEEFWKSTAGAMIYVIGHQPDHPQVISYVNWLKTYNEAFAKELVYDGAEQATKNEFETAIWILQAAVLIDPQMEEAHYNLGLAYYQLGLGLLEQKKDEAGQRCLNQAAGYLQNTLELKPDFSLAYYNLGYIYRKMGLQDRSEEYMEKGILIDLEKIPVEDQEISVSKS